MDINLFSIILDIGIFLLGVMFIILSIYLKDKANRLINNCTASCNGVLIETSEKMRKYRDEDGFTRQEKYYFPIYEFEVDGKKYKVSDTVGNFSHDNIEIGKIVEIKYNPNNPEQCYKKGDIFSKVWLVLLIVGIVCIVEGIGVKILINIIF